LIDKSIRGVQTSAKANLVQIWSPDQDLQPDNWASFSKNTSVTKLSWRSNQ